MMELETPDQYEQTIAGRLSALSRMSASAFGALSAERIIATLGPASREKLRPAMEQAWQLLRSADSRRARQLAANTMADIPDEDEVASLENLIFANAAAAVSYVLQSAAGANLDRIVWAARQALEAAEAAANWNKATDLRPEDAYREISRSKVVQQEIRRQLADLADLERNSTDETIADLRRRAQSSPITEAKQ